MQGVLDLASASGLAEPDFRRQSAFSLLLMFPSCILHFLSLDQHLAWLKPTHPLL